MTTYPLPRRLLIALAFALAAAPLVANAQCATRHFYNNSDYTWFFSLSSGSCSISGWSASMCVVPPGATAEIHYNNGGGNETLFIGSYIFPNGPTYFNNSYSVYDITCYISHGGDTGNASLNDPASGDVSTCAGTTCSPNSIH